MKRRSSGASAYGLLRRWERAGTSSACMASSREDAGEAGTAIDRRRQEPEGRVHHTYAGVVCVLVSSHERRANGRVRARHAPMHLHMPLPVPLASLHASQHSISTTAPR